MRTHSDQFKFGLIVLAVASLIFMEIKCAAQTADSILTYEMTQDISKASKIDNRTKFSSYLAKDGSKIKIGSPLTIGRAFNNGEFVYMAVGWISHHVNVMTDNYDNLDFVSQGEQVIVRGIEAWHSNIISKKSKIEVYILVDNPHKKIGSKRTVLNYEKALSKQEIINTWTTLTRDGAIAKMKESKELLDLGVITQAKYDSLKATLIPIINKN